MTKINYFRFWISLATVLVCCVSIVFWFIYLEKRNQALVLLEEINTCDKLELRMLNSDTLDFAVNGQTIAYVYVRIEKIEALGFSADWDNQTEAYSLHHRSARKLLIK